MENIIFTTEEEKIVQPVGGLIVEDRQEQDHVLGGDIGAAFDVIVPDGQWHAFAPVEELQRNSNGDTFMCVSFSNNNAHEFLIKRLFGETINFSDIFLGVGSGTERGRGNSKRTVAEWKRLNGCVLESDYPYLPTTTLDSAYKPLTDALLIKGKQTLDRFQFAYKWLVDNGQNTLKEGLKYSPIQVDVLGSYKVGNNGYIVWDSANPVYMHEVLIFGYEDGKCWHIFDSESNQYLKFDWSYAFGSPMIHGVTKTMNIEIIKKKGEPGLYVKHVAEPSLIAFSGGTVSGDNLFKSIYGIKDFKQLPIREVDELPCQPIHRIVTQLNK